MANRQNTSKISVSDTSDITYGIALSGGGARGFAHLGVIQGLRDKGIEPGIISGVSAGAIMGAMVASGKSVHEIREILKEQRFFDLSSWQLPKTGFFRLDKLEALFQATFGNINIEDLHIPLIIAATDLLKGRLTYFEKGPLSRIVQASASIPVIFSPVEIDGRFYIDGGVFTNVPLDPIRDRCKHTLISNISPLDETDKVGNVIDIAARTFQLSVNAATLITRTHCDVYIEPPGLGAYPLFDTSLADELYEIGYSHVMNMTLDFNKKEEEGEKSSFWGKSLRRLFGSE